MVMACQGPREFGEDRGGDMGGTITKGVAGLREGYERKAREERQKKI